MMRCKVLYVFVTYCIFICCGQNIRQLRRKIDVLETKQELESKLRKAGIETVFENIDEIEEKISNLTKVIENTEGRVSEGKDSKTDSKLVKLLFEENELLKDTVSRLVRAFGEEKKQNIQNKVELKELTARVSRKHDVNKVSDLVNSILNVKIAELTQQIYLNITEQLKEMKEVNAEIEYDLDDRIFKEYDLANEKIEEHSSEIEKTTEKYRSCLELLEKGGKTTDGVYTIYPVPGKMSGVDVFCDQSTDGGGWTVFQRRKDGSVDFYRTWNEYKVGFGDLDGEFWLGNDFLSVLTSSGSYELRIDLEGWDDDRCYVKYGDFHIRPEIDDYILIFSEFSEGSCGDSLTYHRGMKFTTKDRDNDKKSYNCAENYTGAWWYNACLYSGLNGAYYKEQKGKAGSGVYWYKWKEDYSFSCKSAEMKFR